MTEEFNPYTNTNEPAPRPAENAQPQPPFNRRPDEPASRPQPAPVMYENRPPYPPQYSNAQRPYYQPPAQKTSGAAKVFGVISFIIGCFILLITSMIFFNFRSSVTDKFGFALTWSVIAGLPALIFGVVALMKKTDKKIFAILGITFAAILMLCAFITYFFMVNGAGATSVYRYY